MQVNQELENLAALLKHGPAFLKRGGRTGSDQFSIDGRPRGQAGVSVGGADRVSQDPYQKTPRSRRQRNRPQSTLSIRQTPRCLRSCNLLRYVMTNETKIGLLVGLAFIIVVGILLSPSGLPQMPDASLTAVGNDVRTGTATLHNNSTQNEIVPPPAPPTPSKPVLTHDELREETKIIVTPGGPPVETQTGDHRQTPDRQLSQNSNGSNGASNTSTHSGPADTNEGISPELEQAARQHNVELQATFPKTLRPSSRLRPRWMGFNSMLPNPATR